MKVVCITRAARTRGRRRGRARVPRRSARDARARRRRPSPAAAFSSFAEGLRAVPDLVEMGSVGRMRAPSAHEAPGPVTGAAALAGEDARNVGGGVGERGAAAGRARRADRHVRARRPSVTVGDGHVRLRRGRRRRAREIVKLDVEAVVDLLRARRGARFEVAWPGGARGVGRRYRGSGHLLGPRRGGTRPCRAPPRPGGSSLLPRGASAFAPSSAGVRFSSRRSYRGR